MPIVVKQQAAVPPGQHQGVIIKCEEITRSFGAGQAPEPVIEVTIQPKWKKEGAETLPVNVLFQPVLNGISALSHFLNRLKVAHPADNEVWDPGSIIGKEVLFTAETDGRFIKADKTSIRAA